MTTSITVAPKSDLAGTWEGLHPLPIDFPYQASELLGASVAAYQGGDSAAGADSSDLKLPTLPIVVSEVELVGENHLVYVEATSATSFNIPLPVVAGGILAGDRIEVITYVASLPTPAKPTIATAGYVEFFDHFPAANYQPRLTFFAKVAVGGETGNVVSNHSVAVRCAGRTRVWRNVDETLPLGGVTPVSSSGYSNPNPPAVTTTKAKDMVVVTAAGNRTPNILANATQSPGYTVIGDTSLIEGRSWADSYREIPSPGVEDPAVWTWVPDNSAIVTYVLRPMVSTRVRAYVVTSVADETDTTALASGVELPAANARHSIQQLVASGTFSLTYSGQTTSLIAFDATAATVETALEALSNIGVGDVTVTGGPLDTNGIVVEFTGALAQTNVSLIVAATGTLTIVEDQRGRAQEAFTLFDTPNIPRSGGDYEPQMHVWYRDVVDYVSGGTVFITYSSHGTNHSWAAVLLVYRSTPSLVVTLEASGVDTSGDDVSTATFGTIETVTEGVRILAFMAKSSNGIQYPLPAGPSTPPRYSVAAEAIGDGTTLTVLQSAPISIRFETPAPVSWSGVEDYATTLIGFKPLVAAPGGTLASVVDTQDETSYIELAGSVGSLNEVLEIDLLAVPANAFITGAKLRFAHQSNVSSALRAVLVGINGDDTIVSAGEHQLGYRPTGTGVETVETATWTELADGSNLYDYTRLGVQIFSTSAAVGVTTHKLFWVEVDLVVEEGGPVVSGVAGPTNPGDPITWAYSSDSGLAATAYQVMVIKGTDKDPDLAAVSANAMDPADNDIVYDSGKVFDTAARSLSITDAPLARDTCTFAVRAWARLTTGDEIVSAWDIATVDIAGVFPAGPTQGNNPSWNPATGGVDLTVSTSTTAGTSRAWIVRSVDSGATFQVATDIGPIAITPSTTEVISDYFAPLATSTLRWMVVFDSGPMTESSSPDLIGGVFDTFTEIEGWYLMAPSDPSLNLVMSPIGDGPDVADYSVVVPHRTTTADQAGGALVATSQAFGARISLTVRTLSKTHIGKLEALWRSGVRLRLVSILGEEWFVSLADDVIPKLMQVQPTPGELTTLRNAQMTRLSFIEVV